MFEEAALGVVGGQLDRRGVGVGRLGAAAEAAEQVGAGGVERLVAVEVGASASTAARPAPGPATSATATARLRATTGVGRHGERAGRRAPAIWAQSVSAAVGASLCTALIAAWIWYGPGVLRRRQARTRS